MADLGTSRAQQDSANEIWNMYLEEVKEVDKRIADDWKEGSSGDLVFTGLFSAIVAAFIIEFYKTLSPNSGDQTVALLGEISKQLANSLNGTYSNTANQPSPPSTSMIWVIAMWLVSLVFSLASAVIASLLQQWARNYIQSPYLPRRPNHRARVRSFLFLGTERHKMYLAARAACGLQHFSVYLFFGGLVILFHTINKKVAISVDVAVGLCGLAYIVLSTLPCLEVNSPYHTPITNLLWYPLHLFLLFAALCLRWFVELLCGCLVQPNVDDETMTCKQRVLVRWLDSLENAIKTHCRYFKDGLRKSIINDAINTRGDGDCKIVTRLFNLLSLGDKSKLQRFAAIIPRDKVFKLILLFDSESGKVVLQEPLRILLQSCTAATNLDGPDEDVRKRSLRVCLDAIHNIAKAPNVPDFNFVRTNFANIGLMRQLWGDGDAAIRFTSRSICALLAKKVVRQQLEEPQLRWLQDVTGEASHAILCANNVTRDHMNFKSFVYGVLSNPGGDLPTEDATSFKETLGILFDMGSDAYFDTPAFQTRLSEEVEWIQQSDPEDTQGSREVVYKLRSMFSP